MAKLDIKDLMAQKAKKAKQGAKNTDSSPVVEKPAKAAESNELVDALHKSSKSAPTTSQQDEGGERRDRSASIVDIRTVKEDFQIRLMVEKDPEAYSEESIRQFARTIKNDDGDIEYKVGQPLILARKDDGYYLREGKRRTLACMMLAEETGNDEWYWQPVRFREDRADEDIELFQFNVNNSKEDVDLKTTIALFKKKIAEGWDQKKLVEQTAYSKAKVSKLLKVDSYPKEIQDLIYSGDLPYTGRTLDKALKEFKAASKAISSDTAETAGAQIKADNGQARDVTTVDVEDYIAGQSADGDSDSSTVSTPKPKAKAEGKSETPKPKVPAKKKPGSTYAIDEDVAKKLYRLVKHDLYLHGLEDDPKDIDKVPDRKELLDTLKNIDDLIDVIHEAHLSKSTTKKGE